MKQNLLVVISLSIFSLVELVPLSKPSSRKNTLNAIPNTQTSKKVEPDVPEVRNSAQSIADFTVSVNGTDLILEKEVAGEEIIISTKIPALSLRSPIDPENEICDKEGSFNVELKRGTEGLFKFLCLTPAFFNENATFAVSRLRPDQPITRTSVNDIMNVFSRPSPLSDDRIRQIFKEKDITLDVVEIMLNEAKKRED